MKVSPLPRRVGADARRDAMRPLRRRRRNRTARRNGFTLIESALATVIVGVGVLAIVEAQQSFMTANAWSSQSATGTYLANEIREMMEPLSRHDPVTGIYIGDEGDLEGWGPDAGEWAASATAFHQGRFEDLGHHRMPTWPILVGWLMSLLPEAAPWRYSAGGPARTEELPAGSLAFTLCGVPVVYRLADSACIHVFNDDGSSDVVSGTRLRPRSARRLSIPYATRLIRLNKTTSPATTTASQRIVQSTPRLLRMWL